MVGTWTGLVTTPWVPPYQVRMNFTADGHYAAHCLMPGCVAFYWGSDADSPDKVYDIQGIALDGKARGEIVIWFDGGDINHGVLRNIQLTQQSTALTFELWQDPYGPLKFELRRQ
jgi:hypothetical protein